MFQCVRWEDGGKLSGWLDYVKPIPTQSDLGITIWS